MLQPSLLRYCPMSHWQIPEKAKKAIWVGAKTPAEVFHSLWFWFHILSISPMLSEQTIAKSMAACIPNSKHLTFTFLSKALSQHCWCASPKNKIDTGHLFLVIRNFFQSASLKVPWCMESEVGQYIREEKKLFQTFWLWYGESLSVWLVSGIEHFWHYTGLY